MSPPQSGDISLGNAKPSKERKLDLPPSGAVLWLHGERCDHCHLSDLTLNTKQVLEHLPTHKTHAPLTHSGTEMYHHIILWKGLSPGSPPQNACLAEGKNASKPRRQWHKKVTHSYQYPLGKVVSPCRTSTNIASCKNHLVVTTRGRTNDLPA